MVKINDRRQHALGGQRTTGRDAGGYSHGRNLDEIDMIVWHYTAVARRLKRFITDHERYWKSKNWSRGGYHYYMPIGLFHYRIYQSVARHLDRTYGPTVRLVNKTSERLHDSFSSGKQMEAWAFIWNRFATAEGAKLWVRLCDQVRVISERSKKDDDEPDKPNGGKDRS